MPIVVSTATVTLAGRPSFNPFVEAMRIDRPRTN